MKYEITTTDEQEKALVDQTRDMPVEAFLQRIVDVTLSAYVNEFNANQKELLLNKYNSLSPQDKADVDAKLGI